MEADQPLCGEAGNLGDGAERPIMPVGRTAGFGGALSS